MSRIANSPIQLPKGAELKFDRGEVSVKGSKGSISLALHPTVNLEIEDNVIRLSAKGADAVPMAGTMRALISNMVHGVTEGFSKKLTLIGVGYRAAVQGQSLNLQLGFSHPVEYPIPAGITIECPSQTEILVSGIDKQKVGQVAAEIRAFRPPEPYKGKGVRYADERVIMKEAKKA